MLLYLMRNGSAMSRDDPACPPDPERPLTKKGTDRTRSAARGLKALKILPGVILSSPYLRASGTGEIVAEVLGLDPKKVVKSDALRPDANPKALLAELVLLQENEVLCAGHAPVLDLIIAELVGKSGAPLTDLKKTGVAVLDVHGFRPPKGRLLWLAQGRILRKLAPRA